MDFIANPFPTFLTLWKYAEMATLVLDLGGTHLRVGHLGSSAGEFAVYQTETLRQGEPVQVLTETIRDYAKARQLTPSSVIIGVPFTPDKDLQTALSSPNIPNLEGVPLVASLGEALGCGVTLERDINLLLLGEAREGAARGYRDVFGMFVGTGVGACMLMDGLPYRGATGAAIELGHIPIRGEGRRCVCGNLDCLEAYACGHTLRALAAEHKLELSSLFLEGAENPVVAKALNEFVRDLAFALATGVNLFHPDLAVVGGGVSAMADFPKEKFEATFRAHLRRPVPATSVHFAWASLESEAALYGAQTLLERL